MQKTNADPRFQVVLIRSVAAHAARAAGQQQPQMAPITEKTINDRNIAVVSDDARRRGNC